MVKNKKINTSNVELCSCSKKECDEIGHFDIATLENGHFTEFALFRCKNCKKLTGFPSDNLKLALEEGTEDTKRELNSYIEQSITDTKTNNILKKIWKKIKL